MTKKMRDHFDGITGGMSAVLSAYLLGLATKFIDPVGWSLAAAYLSCFSLITLLLYRVFSFYEQRSEIETKNRLGVLFSVGLTSSLLAYICMLASIQIFLPIVLLVTISVILPFFIGTFKNSKSSL